MSIIIIDRNKIEKELKKAITSKLTYQYKGESLSVTKVDKIENMSLPEDIKQGNNLFSFDINIRRLLDNGIDVYGCFKSLSASFIISEDKDIIIKEPILLIDR